MFGKASAQALRIKGEMPRRGSKDPAWWLPVFICSMVLGVLMTLQFRTQRESGIDLYYTQDNMNRITTYLETERNKLSAEVDHLRGQLQEASDALGEKGKSAQAQAVKLLQEQLQSARMQAGLMPVKGPGVEVRLEDSLLKPAPNEDWYHYVIHDSDIQAFVNELWAAGAEAISINDQRVVTSTSVRCVGPTVLVNTVRLAPPYIISAIGAPQTLDTALRMPNGVLDSMRDSLAKGVRIDIQKKNEMILPEYKGSADFRYTEPVSAR